MQDPIFGIFDKEIENKGYRKIYADISNQLENTNLDNEIKKYILEVPLRLSKVLEIKSEIGNDIMKAYKYEDLVELKNISQNILPELKERIEKLKISHRNLWFEINKRFGWEILDIRYGGLSSRIETVKHTIDMYLEGQIKNIEELDQERLQYITFDGKLGTDRFLWYARIAKLDNYI